MDTAIAKVDIFPDYSGGFLFTWATSGDFNVAPPWVFHVEEAPSVTGPWTDISGPVVDRFMFKESRHRLINKSSVLYYRVRMTAGDNTYFSNVVQPYGDLDRKDFLIGREIMRKEVLHMRGMAGVACSLYSISTFGPWCMKCRDPLTGEIRNSKCKYCLGTGRVNPYNGPYDTWMTFSEDSKHLGQDDGFGTFEHRMFDVRIASNIVVKKNDIIVDRGSDKRYYVNQASVVAEIRRIPLVQSLSVSEAPVSDRIYSLELAK
jgi:hypothetical protein